MCAINGEICSGGICKCGTRETCEVGSFEECMAITCNAAENECSLVTVEDGTPKCKVVGETCQGDGGDGDVKECKCGTGLDAVSSCAGDGAKPICDTVNNRCVECKDKSDCKDDVNTACEDGECVGKQIIVNIGVHIDNKKFL